MSEKGTRLQKAIAQAGLASRRKAEEMILAGQVRVNGVVVRALGSSLIQGQDTLEVDGRKVEWGRSGVPEVWALYKPKNCVTTLSDPEGRPTLKDFFPRSRKRLFPVGRLDYDAEGLILLTDDGELANQVAHPSHSMAKVYLVKVKGLIQPETLGNLAAAPMVDGKRRRPARVRILHTVGDKTWVEVTLKEGVQNHIKKMFAHEGHRVLKIKRYQIGPIALEDMNPGDTRRLEAHEIKELQKIQSDRPRPGKSAATPAGTHGATARVRSRANPAT